MQARFANNPNTGITRWRIGLKLGWLWYPTRQMMQLRPYNRNVPKLEANVIVRSVLGMAANLSWLEYPKLDQKPCGRAWIAASVGAPASPNMNTRARQPTTAEMAASVQIARCGLRFSECSMPKCSGASLSLPMA